MEYRVVMIFVPRWSWSRAVCILAFRDALPTGLPIYQVDFSWSGLSEMLSPHYLFELQMALLLYCKNVSVPSRVCFAQALGDFV